MDIDLAYEYTVARDINTEYGRRFGGRLDVRTPDSNRETRPVSVFEPMRQRPPTNLKFRPAAEIGRQLQRELSPSPEAPTSAHYSPTLDIQRRRADTSPKPQAQLHSNREEYITSAEPSPELEFPIRVLCRLV